MSRLEKIPESIRRKILGNLLSSECVRQPPDHLLVEHYAFEVNILRANRSINKEGMTILYGENTFVKVHNDFSDTETSMLNHEVPFFKVKGRFDHHVADVTIKIDPMNKMLPASKILKKPATFLILLEDIPKYIRLLRLLDFANFMGYQFEFKSHQPRLAKSHMSPTLQEHLLFPFKQVRGCALIQNVTFVGPFENTIVQQVKHDMTQKVAWLRAAAWEIHDITLSIKRMGDKAFRLGNADMAMAKYDDTLAFMQGAIQRNKMIRNLDQKFEKAMAGIECMTQVDIALLAISDAAYKESGKRMYQVVTAMVSQMNDCEASLVSNDPIVPPQVVARYLYLLGAAELGLKHPNKAGRAFAKSYKISTDESTKAGYEAAKTWGDLRKKTQTARLNGILASLPKEPISIPDMTEYTTPEVASEHWVMRELGLQGTIPYEDKIKGCAALGLTNKPHPNHHNMGPRTAWVGAIKPEILRKHVENYRKQMTLPIGKGRLTCWVGLTADKIGEETILDEPALVEAMRNIGRSGCAPQ